jgi:alginate O-acetyltransferase complex protein AlgI
MDSASFQFVAFGLIAAGLSNCSPSRLWRSTVLLAVSITFIILLAGSVWTLVPLVAFLCLGYSSITLKERGWLWTVPWCTVTLVLVYIWLKKYTFIPHRLFLSSPYFTLGLSYIFFRVLHLLVDSRGQTEGRHLSVPAYLLYSINFTTLISGPIQRYEDFSRDQFAPEPVRLGPRIVGRQLERIVLGLFKVNVVAMILDMLRNDALMQMTAPLPLAAKMYAALRLALVYPLFLYANFSGYIDVVIALARLMRVRLPENFDRPFAATSVMEFWSRWHMTLSNWLKIYVYNPMLMGLMRRTSSTAIQPWLGVLCYFITFFLIGLWHGRTSEFIVFGILTGGGVSANKLWQLMIARCIGQKSYRVLARDPVYCAFGRGLNFAWFGFTLFWFWGSWPQIDRLFTSLGVAWWLIVWICVWLCATAVGALWEWARTAFLSIRVGNYPLVSSRYVRVVYTTALAFATFVMTVLLNQPAPAIVYRSF